MHVARGAAVDAEIDLDLVARDAADVAFAHVLPDGVAVQRRSVDADAAVAVAARIAGVLVGGAHQTELVALLQTVLDRALPDARTHVVQIVVVARVALGKPVAREHLDERRLPVLDWKAAQL